jgi:3-(3-hydroxy-phenyl)propionate hydroxylase
MFEQRDVVVVGAGPVGLTLALGLARSGIDVLVLEKNEATAEHSRAPAVWPRSQEIFSALGVLEQLFEEGILLPRVQLWDVDRERVLLELPIEELRAETEHAQLLIVPQSATERVLHHAIRDKTTGEVRFSSEVTGLTNDSAGVVVKYRHAGREQEVHARFVAGCDGAGSRVSELIGGSLEGITYRVEAALADVEIASGDAMRFPRLTTEPRLAIGIRLRSRLWRLILPFADGSGEQSLEQRIDDAARSLFPQDRYDTIWKSEFRLHRRISTHWTDGRIVLAGDAAHLNSPVGGEGMNAGIIDAAMLREALVEALARDDREPLVAYATQRRKSIEQGVNPLTDRMTRLLLAGNGRLIRPMFRMANLVLKIAPLRRRLLRRLALLDGD